MKQPKEHEQITIKDFRISRHQGGGFWIEHESGEGMQVKEDVLYEVIKKFYSDTF